MELQYVIATLIVFVAVAYYQSTIVFSFAREGEDYLKSLLKAPEKVGNDTVIIDILQNRDLPRLTAFISYQSKLNKVMYAALFVNCVAIFYPQEALFNHFFGWIVMLVLTIVNADVIMTFFGLRRNKKLVDRLCDGYYQFTISHEKEKAAYDNMAEAIHRAFGDIDKKLNNVEEEIKKVDDEDGKDGNEQR